MLLKLTKFKPNKIHLCTTVTNQPTSAPPTLSWQLFSENSSLETRPHNPVKSHCYSQYNVLYYTEQKTNYFFTELHIHTNNSTLHETLHLPISKFIRSGWSTECIAFTKRERKHSDKKLWMQSDEAIAEQQTWILSCLYFK